jgi:myo-inositol 2-dehydrogenase/D-chiro-inositol 1-dehydrogenase
LLVGAGRRARGIVSTMERTGFRVDGVVEPDPGRRDAARAELGVGRVFAHVDELPAAADFADCAFVVTPPWLHADAFIACAARGLPIFCEKPMDMDLRAAERMRRAAAAHGVRTMFGFNRRYTPVGRLARSLTAGAPPRFVHTSKSRPMTYSRMLAENSVHAVDLLLCLAGSIPERVAAVGAFKDAVTEAEAHIAACVAFLGGGAGSFQMVTSGEGAVERVEVYGEDYTLRGDLGGVVRYEGEPMRLRAAAVAAGVTLEEQGGGRYRVGGEADLDAELRAFAEVVRAGRRDVPDAEAAFEAQRLVEAIYREAGLPPTRWSPQWVRES